MPESIRAHVIYRGTVQGVGFRATTHLTAQPFAVVGSVRNLPDGSVEVIAEGDRPEVEAFLSEVAQRLRHRIDTVDRQDGEPTGQDSTFHIAF